MSDKSSENYLDNLLGSISGTTPSAASAAIEEVQNTTSSAGTEPKELDPLDPDTLFGTSSRSEDEDFLRAFEAELESDAYKEYFADFEHNMEEDQKHDLEIETTRKSAPEGIASILQGLEDGTEDVSAVPAMPNPEVENPEELLRAMEQHEVDREQLGKLETLDGQVVGGGAKEVIDLDSLDDLAGLEGLDGIEQIGEAVTPEASESGTTEIPEEAPLKMTEDGEGDLSGMSDEDLFSMLANSEGMDDIGNLLDKNDSGESVSEEDAFAEYAEQQMEEDAEDEEEDAPKKKKKKGKKAKAESGEEVAEEGGFFAKLKRALFGPDDEDEEPGKVALNSGDGASPDQLMEENMAILAELDGEASGGKKAKKEKKPKKEKPKKEPKPKKEKPKKEPKPKKEKAPKDVVKLKPLPKKPIFMIVLMVASLMVFIILSTNLVNYSSNIGKANRYMSNKKYTEAFRAIEGMEIKDNDELLYNQAKTLAAVDSQYQAFCVFSQVNDQVNALDSLICAAGRYELNMKNAEQYSCVSEMEYLGGLIREALSTCYGMTMEEANEIYTLKNRKDYTIELHRKLRQLGLE